MAKNDRDDLLKAFVSRGKNRRKKTGPNFPAFPRGNQGQNAKFSRFTVPPPGGPARTRITEDDPRWNASTMGNKTGYYKGKYYERGRKSRGGRNYNKGNRPG